ncbi:MAG: ComEC/Rec2 family competence protein [Acidimicrobiaceae bacterium]|nr:ComEC/Rec2 family competence protein [Acidimicrobiaceae bacterium]
MCEQQHKRRGFPVWLDLLNSTTAKPYAAMFGAAVGAWLLPSIPLTLMLLVSLVYLRHPNTALTFIIFVFLTGFSGGRAVDGLVAVSPKTVDGWVTLLDDPRKLSPSGVRVTVRYEGKRFEAYAYGLAAGRLHNVLTGERIHISGALRGSSSEWQRWRHIVGKITVETVNDKASSSPLLTLTNGIRRLLSRGAESLSRDARSLFTGMVYGDNRQQSDRLADDFQAAGLGHLLVVSGQNVAFVLMLASPLTCRLRPGARLVVLLAVLSVFATITRFEPSVLRAVAMAMVAVSSTALGRPDVGRSSLAWAIAGVLVIDPFVLRLLAFQLSVCATAGILWITPLLAEVFRGPRLLRLALATTAGAQIAVMPLLIVVFDRVPLASLPANIVAGPASGPVMMWGLTAGFVAGLAGGWVAWLVHQPTEVLLWWVRFVAESAAAMPQAMINSAGALGVAVGVILLLATPKTAKFSCLRQLKPFDHLLRSAGFAAIVRPLGVGMLLTVFAISVAGAVSSPLGWSVVAGAAVFHDNDNTIVVLDQPERPRHLLESLRLAGVGGVDLIVATEGDAADAYAVLALTERYRGAVVVAPPMHRVPNARTVNVGVRVKLLNGLQAIVVSDDPHLEIELSVHGFPAKTSLTGG